jgi:predicted nuclease with TOPRIM domain
MELQVNDSEYKRLEKIEDKIDKLSDAVISIARIEERVNTVLKQNERFFTRMDKLENRVETVEQKALVNTKGIGSIERFFWIIVSAVVAAIMYNFR